MPEFWYMLAAVALSGLITLLLRAVPFAILKPLRKSKFVQKLGQWMPVGILLILAVVVVQGEIAARPEKFWSVAAAAVVTILVHLFAGRRALVSIFVGTGVYVLLINFF
ncbi:branched-chain amino acid transporter permease [Leucobacter sp. W1153]|uniref:branched-chain amino acid transporter permease n=1 Tax=unclassified Leucobacter TaxID=2621730 RepID=UPI003F321B86